MNSVTFLKDAEQSKFLWTPKIQDFSFLWSPILKDAKDSNIL